MMKMKNTFCGMMIALSLFGGSVVGNAAQKSGGGTDWNKGVIRGVGYGARPSRISSLGKARLMAREAALADAYRALASRVSGVSVDGNTTVREHEEESQEIKTSVSAMIQNARVVSESDLPDGTYEVTLELPMWGEDGLAGAMSGFERNRNEFDGDNERLDRESDRPIRQISPDLEKRGESTEENLAVHTGLVIDARGLHVSPCMSPRILFPDGSEVWGTMSVSPEIANTPGIAAYYKTYGDAIKSNRAGKNPLVVKATGRSGKLKGNVVVSEEDGKNILAENASTGFLKNLKVVFLVDETE